MKFCIYVDKKSGGLWIYLCLSKNGTAIATTPMMILRIACQSGSVPMSETPGSPAMPIIRIITPTIIKVHLV